MDELNALKNFKINILLKFHEGPWGGGNQFLKALKKGLKKKRLYEDDPEKAECIIFNSHHHVQKALTLKLKDKNKLFFHRIDGPLYLARNKNLEIDYKIYELNQLVADGTIFQSELSKRYNYSLGLKKSSFEKKIMNASNPELFFPINDKKFEKNRKNKVKLISTSWSTNKNKGFDLYQFLDNNLDFNQYSMLFIGSSPIEFKNIEHINSVPPKMIAHYLRESDIYISGSKYEACSNTLIEALTSGLPCVVFNIESNNEILKKGGELFNSFSECIKKIELIVKNYERYRINIKVPSIQEISNKYIDFIGKIFRLHSLNKYEPKKLRKIDYYRFRLKYIIFKNERRRIINQSFRIISSIMIRILRNYKKNISKYFILMRLISSKKKISSILK